MFSLGIRKLLVISLAGGIFLLANLWLVVNWLEAKGVIAWAGNVRKEYLTGTAITVILALLILLAHPRHSRPRLVRRCPVCDHLLWGRSNYCGECGSKV